jgi:hypothetical protein
VSSCTEPRSVRRQRRRAPKSHALRLSCSYRRNPSNPRPPFFRIFFQVPYRLSPLLLTLTKLPGGAILPNSGQTLDDYGASSTLAPLYPVYPEPRRGLRGGICASHHPARPALSGGFFDLSRATERGSSATSFWEFFHLSSNVNCELSIEDSDPVGTANSRKFFRMRSSKKRWGRG